MIYILAGTSEQAKNYAIFKNTRNYRIVDSLEYLASLPRGTEITLVVIFHRHWNIKEFEIMAAERDFKLNVDRSW